jgi:hypothetical protein
VQVKEHYRLGEAAAILGISYEALKGRCRRKTIKHLFIGKHRYISATILSQIAPHNWSRYIANAEMDIGT